MELYQALFTAILEKESQISGFPVDPTQLAARMCYQTLDQIRAILADDRLDDPECFQKIEAIVCLFESLGSNGGTRHDFG